jgi:hypothetical protein
MAKSIIGSSLNNSMKTIIDITNLPTKFKESAIDLKAADMIGHAWHLNDAIELTDWIKSNTDIIILGGDLYLSIPYKQVIYTMREDWYFEPKGTQMDHADSTEKALQFLTIFRTHPMHPEIVVKFILDD